MSCEWCDGKRKMRRCTANPLVKGTGCYIEEGMLWAQDLHTVKLDDGEEFRPTTVIDIAYCPWCGERLRGDAS